MSWRTSKPFMVALTTVSILLYLGLAALGWGGWRALFAHPARAGVCLTTIILAVIALFSQGNLGSGKREDVKNRWVFLPIFVIGFLLGWLPAYTDRYDVMTLDGDTVRYLGLGLYVVGGVLRLVPVFALGRRFSGLVAIQEGHQLLTTGIYRWLRNPSYLGLLLGLAGWDLVFRSALGLLLTLPIVAVILARIHSEEALLLSEFGEEYEAYRRRTWRLLPWIY
ncbi:MAG TPA: isoprenylcysteine carboxylmethyltransferase family protein [Isosphaeraceae bacterium]|nr:isoprenylcysteine carboxylmethyltransferase family protein [Isosphaeraceae bacterium]